MTTLLRRLFDQSYVVMEKSPVLGVAKPAVEALDTFFFRPPRVTEEAPYIRDALDLKRYMITVVWAMTPAMFASIYLYGWRAVVVILLSYVFGVGTEWVFAAVRKEEINEGAFVTCMIYPLILPPTLPLWMVPIGIVFGILFGKEAFGGTGKNIFNPAMLGRLFVALAFPSAMTTRWYEPIAGGIGGFGAYSPAADALTGATPLIQFKGMAEMTAYADLLIGRIPGSFGETSKVLILLGGVFLMYTKVANWRLPVACLGSVAVFGGVMHVLAPARFPPVPFELLSGGLLFGAMFMVTDPVSAPFTRGAKWIYGIAIGVLTVIIRHLSGYVEGVMFAVIFMNIFAPLLDHLVLSLRYQPVEEAAL